MLEFLVSNQVSDFKTIFVGIIVESFPFIILGILVSAIFAVFVKDEFIYKFLPKNRFLKLPVLSLLGVFMPVCECGNVPVVRRFLKKKLSVAHSVTFLLAAPILNPITIFSTSQAFGWDSEILVYRILGGFIIANLVGLIVLITTNSDEDLLTEDFYKEVCDSHHHDHSHDKLRDTVSIFIKEFNEVMGMMLIGALIAAFTQIFIPRDIITQIGTNLPLSILAMMIMAFVVSICANVDAFFALSYANTFSKGSIVSFLTFGPMVDIKIFSMLKTTFKIKFLVYLTSIIALLSFILGILVNLLQ